jgi:leucyl aminopeptidase
MTIHVLPNGQPVNDGCLVIPIAKDKFLTAPLYDLNTEFPPQLETLKRDFSADKGETCFFYNGEQKVWLLGLGEKPSFATALDVFKNFSYKNKKNLLPSLGIRFSLLEDAANFGALVEGSVNGLLLGTYDIGLYKTSARSAHPMAGEDAQLNLYGNHEAAIAAASNKAKAVAETQLRIFDLVNAPGNKAIPETLAHWAVASGREHGFSAKVLDEADIEAAGLHALLAVNRGSEFPPTFIIMEYIGAGTDIPVVGLVGKGVTFDTGGISIKPSQNMHYMKSDMGGAAAVLGAVELAAKLKLPIHLIGIVPSTDNCVDATATKPGDVIESYSGKTIEVIDTDAEGRLLLADGLAYMERNFRPDVMIDLATLTGSIIQTLGYHAAGLFCNNPALADSLIKAGEETGEKLWMLPIWDAYKDEVESDVADVKNFHGKPIAGAIVAAKFLEAFTNEHPAWAHLDIAGMAFGNFGLAKDRCATGFGIRLLNNFLENIGSSKFV